LINEQLNQNTASTMSEDRKKDSSRLYNCKKVVYLLYCNEPVKMKLRE